MISVTAAKGLLKRLFMPSGIVGLAQDVWARSLPMLQKSSTIYFDFRHLFECLLDRLSTPELELFPVQAWLIWNQRNVIVHGGQIKDPRWLNKRAAEYLKDCKKAQENLAIASTVSSRNVWQPPPPDVYKLNFDVAIFSDLKCSGFGAIIKNSTSEVMAGISANGPYVSSSEEAEALACRNALEFSMEAGFFELVIEWDCQNVMRAISASTVNESLLGHIYEDIRCYMSSLLAVSISWVKRGEYGNSFIS